VISHVLMTADAVGGVWTYALDLAAALAARGVQVSLAVLGPVPSDSQRIEAARVPGLTLHTHAGRLEWMDDPWDDVDDAGVWLLRLADALCPDVVHLNGYCHAALAWDAPVVVVGHSCVLSWWRAVHGCAAPASWDRYRAAVAAGLAAADVVVTPTAAMGAALEREYGAMARRCVVPNGRYPVPNAAAKEPCVMSAGRLWDDAKNVRALCEVAPTLTWPVYLAGDVRHPSGETLAVPGHCLGRLDAREMAGWLARASIYALPALYEPFGLSILEAASAQCALVLGDIASLRELWDGAALFVAPHDRSALTAAINRLVDDAALRREMANAAETRAACFTPGHMAESYLYVYLAASQRRGRLDARPAPLASVNVA
jgi:glycogen synthase